MAVIGELRPFFGEVARLLRQIAQGTCSGTATTSAGTGSIPSGYKSISIVKTSSNADSVVITLSDASTYTMTEKGEVFTQASNGTLPAYVKSGAGTIKWNGVK